MNKVFYSFNTAKPKYFRQSSSGIFLDYWSVFILDACEELDVYFS